MKHSLTTLAVLLVLIGTAASPAADAPEAFKVLAPTGKAMKPMKTDGGPKPEGDANHGALTPTAEDRKLGYVLFSRVPHEPVHFNTMPRPGERTDKLAAFASPGEFEPLVLGVAALEDLAGITATCSALGGPDGARIGVEQMDLRYGTRLQRMHKRRWLHFPEKTLLAPYLLETLERASIAKGNAGLIWLTVHVPADAKPGKYTGTLILSMRGKPARKVPAALDVLPIKLVEPKRAYLMSAHPVWGKSGFGFRGVDDEMTRKFFVDLAAHGITRFNTGVRVRGVRADKITDAQLVPQFDHLDKLVKLGKRHGLSLDTIAFYVDSICAWRGRWFQYFPLTKELDNGYVRVVKKILAEGKRRGWGEFYIMSGDEPGGHPATMKPIKHYLELLKTRVPEARTVICIGGGMRRGGIREYEALRKALDLPVTSLMRDDLLKAIRADGKTFWCYGSAGNGPASQQSSRHRPGFYAARAKPAGVLMWCYHWFIGYQPGKGPVPTIPWEMVREGIDDARYVATLEALIDRAAKAGANAAAGAAHAKLDAILKQIDPVYGDWSKGRAKSKGGELPDAAKVGAWRRAIADEILTRQKALAEAR